MNMLTKAGLVMLVVAGAAEVALRRDDTTPPASAAGVERGEQLFLTKGCVTCHTLNNVESIRIARLNLDLRERTEHREKWVAAVGPDLTRYSNDPTFLRRWLEQPDAVREKTMMPDLQLSAAEIENLILFINRER